MFCKKFQSKTGNKWADRAKFVPKSGKYTLLEMDDGDEEEELPATGAGVSPKKVDLSQMYNLSMTKCVSKQKHLRGATGRCQQLA